MDAACLIHPIRRIVSMPPMGGTATLDLRLWGRSTEILVGSRIQPTWKIVSVTEEYSALFCGVTTAILVMVGDGSSSRMPFVAGAIASGNKDRRVGAISNPNTNLTTTMMRDSGDTGPGGALKR